MSRQSQDKFRKRVKVWLSQDRSRTVNGLAKAINRRRDTVSTAINHPRFPRVRAQIEEVIG